MRFQKKLAGLVVVAIFLAALAGTASAASLDLPKWVIVPEDSQFSDVTLFCPFDAYDASTNTTPCYIQGNVTNVPITFNSTIGYPKLVSGRIGNAFEFKGAGGYIQTTIPDISAQEVTLAVWVKFDEAEAQGYPAVFGAKSLAWFELPDWGSGDVVYFVMMDTSGTLHKLSIQGISKYVGKWLFVVGTYDGNTMRLRIYDANGNVLLSSEKQDTFTTATGNTLTVGTGLDKHFTVDEGRLYTRVLSDDEIKLLLLAGRKKLSQPAQFRQIFSPMIDLTKDRATFYAGLEVSTTDPSGYVPVPESAVNMSITSAPRLKSDYTNADFYYQGHYWYRADKIQYNLPIQFETVRESGGFSHTVILDEDKKTFVYEKEFKVTNPTAAKLNVVYKIDPLALGFSALQYPEFELDGVRMVSWTPNNSSAPVLIATDTLEPGEISTHWIKSTWTLSKEELNFPAKLDDFREITSFDQARKLAENAAEGKVDTYVRVIKIDSTADMANMTVLVPLKDVRDTDDVIEATALTGAHDTLQVEKLSDGKIVVKVPGQDFVSGHAEVKVLYNKSGGSWLSQLIEKIKSLFSKIFGIFGGG